MKAPPSPNSTLDISTSRAVLSDGEDGVALKISSLQIEVNVWLSLADASMLHSVVSQSPDSKALRLGHSAGAAAHWSRDDEDRYYLMIGEDDETWDIGLTFDRSAFEAMLEEIRGVNGVHNAA